MRYYNKSYSLEEATRIMENYCAYQERCRQEVLKKLKNMRMIPEVIDHIMEHLIERRLLNEERFAKAYTSGKFRTKNWGRNKIRQELLKRNISKHNIEIALKELSDDSYLNNFHHLAEKRWQQLQVENNLQKRKRKLADYLLYRGWDSQLIYDKIAELAKV